MIIVKIQGGLGNQLFEYAFARRLAHDFNAPLKLDTTNYDYSRLDDEHPDKKFKRGYGLDKFNTIGNFATDKEINKLKRYRPREGRLGRFLNPLLSNASVYLKERELRFSPEYLTTEGLATGKDVFIDGYFLSEKYFKSIEGIIRKELTWRMPPDEKNKEIFTKINQAESVAIHVRRGNFVIGKYKDIHGVCPESYYKEAIREIRDRVKNPQFFVFSDDHAWTKANLELGADATYVDHNGPEKDYEDIRLMSACKHHIIANSSFSWWGAWLSQNTEKVVICPSKLLKKDKTDAKDFPASGWITLKTELI